jgi:hypothetical protein
VKMIAHHWIDIPHWLSLAIIVGLLGVAIWASLWAGRRERLSQTPAKPD